MKAIRSVFWTIIFSAGLLFCAVSAHAALSMTVSPVDGVDSIRFSSFDVQNSDSKEVRIRVNSSAQEQYQVFLRTLTPLTNEKGVGLDSGGLQFYSLAGSNGFGALYAQNVESVSFPDDLIYSSSQNGDSDSFNLIFSLATERLNASGNFLGSLLLTLRPVREGAVQEVVLNVFVDLKGQLKFDVSSARGTDLLEIVSEDPLRASDQVVISWEEGLSQQIHIFQEAVDFLRNEEGDFLDKQKVVFRVEAVHPKGVQVPVDTPWQRDRELIYSGNDSENEVMIHWQMGDEASSLTKADRYSGRIRYVIETDESSQEFALGLDVVIAPIFELELKFPQGKIHFSELLPDSPPKEQEVEVVVKTNLRRPYAVVQELTDPLANKKGDEIEADFFTQRVTLDKEGKGKTDKEAFIPVKTGQDDVFYSDRLGTSASFKVTYRLRPYRTMEPGDYSAAVRFSLVEQ